MSLLKGKQIATGSDGVNTANIVDGALAASAGGRAKMATSFFDSTTTTDDKFAAASLNLSRLAEAVIQADGGQAFTADQSMGGFKLTNLGAPIGASDAARKQDVDAIAAGLSWKDAVKAASVTNDFGAGGAVAYVNGTAGVGATLTGPQEVFPTQDGVTIGLGDRLLAKNQSAGEENGIYELTVVGVVATTNWVLTRVTDADVSAELDGAAIFVQQGTVHADQGWTQTANAPTIGTTALTWTQFTGTGGITFGTPGTIQPDDTADQGVSANASRADHRHAIVAAAAGTIEPDDVAAEGVATSFARSDHKHAIAAAVAVGLGTANAEGASTSFARADHVHARDTANQEQVTAEAITGTDTAITDTLSNTPLSTANFKLFLNGMLQQEGAGNDYTRSGVTITWLASSGTAVDLETTDELIACYDS